MSLIRQVFLKLLTPKNVFFQMDKRACLINPLAVNVLMSPKNSWNLHKGTFIILFHYSRPD